MTINPKAALIGGLLCFSLSLQAQNQYNLPEKKYYEKATIGFLNFQKIDVKKLVILGDSIQYTKDETISRLHLDSINYLRVTEGTKTGNGALIGGISTLVISLVSVMQVQSDPDYELKENVGGLVTLYTLGGTAVGAIIGSTIQRKKSYYVHATKNEL